MFINNLAVSNLRRFELLIMFGANLDGRRLKGQTIHTATISTNLKKMIGKLFNKKKKELKEVDESYVFDKAKYHFDSINEAKLDAKQAYVHTGLFFAWIIKNDLYSEFLLEESKDEIEQTKSEKISPAELYMNWDGVLIGELLNKIGFNFTMDYFEFEKGEYVNDYEEILSSEEDPDIFRVKNNWENYHKIAKIIDERFEKWNKNWL